MEEKDLIKKLENLELPEIEISSHKRKLKMALMSSEYFQKPKFFEIFKKSFVFAGATLILLIIFFTILIVQPKLIEGRALEIVKKNSEVQKLMEEKNLVLDEVKIKNGKAFVLLSPPELEEAKEEKISGIIIEKTEMDEVEGMIIEVDFEKEKVAQIKPVRGEDITPLAHYERESAKEIVKKEEILKRILPKEAKIEKIQSSLPRNLRLIEKNDEVKVVPGSKVKKRAKVYYVFDGEKWIIEVNLLGKKVEEIKYSPPPLFIEERGKGRP